VGWWGGRDEEEERRRRTWAQITYMRMLILE
jgi:hypothetical protein